MVEKRCRLTRASKCFGGGPSGGNIPGAAGTGAGGMSLYNPSFQYGAAQPNPWLSGIGSGLQGFGSSMASSTPSAPYQAPTITAQPYRTPEEQLAPLIPTPATGLDDLIAAIQRILGSSGGGTGGSTGMYG